MALFELAISRVRNQRVSARKIFALIILTLSLLEEKNEEEECHQYRRQARNKKEREALLQDMS